MSRMSKVFKYLDDNNYEKALEEVNSILQKDPYDISALKIKAEIYYRQNRLQKALITYKELDSVYEQLPAPLQEQYYMIKLIARIYTHINETVQAIKYTKKAVQIYELYNKTNPAIPIHLKEKIFLSFNLTELYTIEKEFNKALSHYDWLFTFYRTYEDLESFADVILAIVDLFTKQTFYQKAIKFYTYALQQYEDIEEYPGIIGLIHYSLRNIYF